MKKMIVKNWKRIAAVIMAAIMVMGSVNFSEFSTSAAEENNAPNIVGGKKLDEFSLYQFLTYYQYVIKENATIGNHTVGSVLIGGVGSINAFGEGAIAPVYINNLLSSGNYAERYSVLSKYYSGRVPAYYGKGSTIKADGWNEWDSDEAFVNFDNIFSTIKNESKSIAEGSSVTVDFASGAFSITGENASAVTVTQGSIQGKGGNLLTIDFSKFSGDNRTPRNITITEAAYKKLDVIDIRVDNIDDFNYPHNISILGDSVNVSYAYNPAMGTRPSAESAVCVTINGSTFQGGALKSMTGNTQGAQLLDAPMELLWNFPEAKTATVEYLGGHVVAPNAELTIYGGNFEGGVIAESVINTSAEGHMYPYYGIPKTLEETAPMEPILPTDSEESKITVSVSIEKIFGNREFSSESERQAVLDQTCFAVYTVNNGVVKQIPYNQSNDTVEGVTANTAIYSDEFSFTAKEGETYYFYVAEIATDMDRYSICNSRWAIKVEVGKNGSHSETYVQYDSLSDKTIADLNGYSDKTDSLEFKNTEKSTYTIGLIKEYDGLTLASIGDDSQIQAFLEGTNFEFIEVNENGQPVSGATATTLHPAWDGNHAVVSQKITITEGETRYYKIRETKASTGFEMSADVYMWKVTCSDTGVVSAEYKIGDASYTSYTANTDYPTVTNARVPYSETISLIKTYQDVTLTALGEDARTNLLNGTTFALYDTADAGAEAIVSGVHPVWENNQAVVKFALNDLTIDVGKSVVYYIRETAASTGYVKSDIVYECQIRNVNGQYEVGYRAGNNGDYVSAITCNNVKQTVNIDSVTVVINKTFNDSFLGLSDTQISYLLSETKFAFYENENCTNKVNDFTLQASSPARGNGGSVTYIYDYTGTLSPGSQLTYYVKETATNESIYTRDPAVYKIVITVGEAENGIANQTIKPSVEYLLCTTGNKVDRISFTNTRIRKAQSPATITFTKVFENNFSNVTDPNKISGIISSTSFTLYNDSDCVNPVTGFSNPATNRNGENVTYKYSLTISSLDVDKTYYYYLKETYTDPKYYRQNDKTYVVRITIDADGNPTVDYAEYQQGTADEKLSYSGSLNIENKQVPEDATPVLNSPVITFTKEFEDFAKYIDSSDIITATTFTLTGADGAGTIGFRRQSPEMTDKGATYSYQLDLSGVDASAYTGGTYYIKENETDSRYTKSTEVLEIIIEVTDREAKATFVGSNTFHNTLKSDNSSADSTPNTSTNSTPTSSSSTSSTPTTSSTSSTSTASTSSTPTTSSTPSVPLTPNTPSTPQTPDTPNSWVTSDGKVHYEILIEYEHIDSSSASERIEELITNTTIKITDQNGNDVTEHVTQIAWDPSRNVAVVTVEAPKPSEGFDTYYVVEDTDPADNDLSHSEPGRGFTVAITSDGKVLFQEDGSATPTTEMRFVNVEKSVLTASGTDSRQTMTSMTSAQTGERKLPWAVFGGGMSTIFIAGAVYVFKKKEMIER